MLIIIIIIIIIKKGRCSKVYNFIEICITHGMWVDHTARQKQVSFIYRKILKIHPGAYIFQRPFLRGLSMEENLRFKINWASLIVGSKFTVFALFYFVFEGNFPSTSHQGGLYLEGPFNGGFFALLVWGTCITFGWAYFRNFTVYLYIFTSGHGCAQWC